MIKADEAIKLANAKGRRAVAKSIACQGMASKKFIQKEFLPELEEAIKTLKTCKGSDKINDCWCKIRDLIGLLAVYGIQPDDLIGEAISCLINQGSYIYAVSLTDKGSALTTLNVLLDNPSSEKMGMVKLSEKKMNGKELSLLLEKLECLP
ncbi:MAG: hypothetical protein WC397_02525 [Candidatus Paceibacterota bacterium]|jgi:hypothetical protein